MHALCDADCDVAHLAIDRSLNSQWDDVTRVTIDASLRHLWGILQQTAPCWWGVNNSFALMAGREGGASRFE
jgi:hypothetical protein